MTRLHYFSATVHNQQEILEMLLFCKFSSTTGEKSAEPLKGVKLPASEGMLAAWTQQF